MTGRGRSILLVAVFTATIALGGGVMGAHASGVTTTDTQLTGFGRMLLDPGSSHVFISSPADNSIAVLDLSGHLVKTVSSEPGADAMVVNGTTLYVALTGSGSIGRINTSTLISTTPLVTGLTYPNDLAYAGNRIWLFDGHCGAVGSHLASVDPSAVTPTVTTYTVSAGCNFATNHVTNPSLLVTYAGTTITTFDVSSGSPVENVTSNLGNAPIQDAEVMADGLHMMVTGTSLYVFQELKLSDLTLTPKTYPGDYTPTAVDSTAANGGIVVGGTGCGFTNLCLFAYSTSDWTNALVTYGTPDVGAVDQHGIAIAPGGTSAFAVWTGQSSHTEVSVVAIPVPPQPSPPGPPQNVYSIPGNGQAWVNWVSPAIDGGQTITGYTITTLPGGATTTVAATQSQLDMTGLTNGLTYTFSVAAVNSVGAGQAVAANPVTSGTQQAPYNPSAQVGVGSATVTWTPGPTDSTLPAITSYTVTSSAGGTVTVPAPAPSGAVLAGLSSTPQTFTVTADNAWGSSPQSTPSNQITPLPGGTFHPVTPARILDTRYGVGGFAVRRVAGNTAISVVVLGQGGVPANHVTAVALNITVTDTAGPGYLTAYPAGVLRPPTVSNLNFNRGQTVPNLVQVAVGSGGAVSLYVGVSAADLIVDVQGWIGDQTNSYTRLGLFNALAPTRVLDTRSGKGAPAAKLGPFQSITLQLAGGPGELSAGDESAVVLNLTATGGTQDGYLTVYPTGATAPLASNLNFTAGQTVANRVMVGLGTNGSVTIVNGPGQVDVLADLNGWFTSGTSTVPGGSAYVGTEPSRLFDTRTCHCKILPGYVLTLQLSPTVIIAALGLNVTATNPTANGYLTVYPSDLGGPPLASDLNFRPGDTVANMTVTMLMSAQAIDVFNPLGSTDVIIDIDGYYGQGVNQPTTTVPVYRISERLNPNAIPIPAASFLASGQ